MLDSYIKMIDLPDFKKSHIQKIQKTLEKCRTYFDGGLINESLNCSRELWATIKDGDSIHKREELKKKLQDFKGTINGDVIELDSGQSYFSNILSFLEQEEAHGYDVENFQAKIEDIKLSYADQDMVGYRWSVINLRSMLQHQFSNKKDRFKKESWDFLTKSGSDAIHNFTDKSLEQKETFTRIVEESERVLNALKCKVPQEFSVGDKRPSSSASGVDSKKVSKSSLDKE